MASPDEDLFDGLTALTDLYLQSNGMASPDEDLFDGLTALTTLNLSNNGMASPDEDLFDGLTALTTLNLSNNSIASPHVDLFDDPTALTTLNLSDNSIASLNVNLFDGLVGLSALDLSGNSITGLTAGVFLDQDDSLTSLYLRSNGLASLPAAIFDGLTGLTGLDLSCNALTALDLARFNPFALTLTFLEISGNSFTTPPTDMALRAKLTNVGYLYTGLNTSCGPPDDIVTSEFSISPGSPPTAAGLAMVAHDVSTITVTITTRDPNAEVVPYASTPLYDDDANAPGWQVKLPFYRNVFQWQVRSKNGMNTEIGNLIVSRANPPASEARLYGLELSGLTLAETFDKGTQTYTATAAEGVTETTVTATPLDPDATAVVKLNGTEDADGTVDLQVGENAITVEVIAEDGSTMRTYTVTVTLEVIVSFESGEYYVTEGATVEVTVVLSNAAARGAPLTISLGKVDDTATGADYSGFPGSVDIDANETSASFTITATQDTAVEGDESFHMTLFQPSGTIYGDHFSTTVHIIDDDTPGLAVFPRRLNVDEGGTATYTVKLNTAPTGNVTVAITSSDTGAATVDPAMLTFTPTDWNTAQTVRVTGVLDSDQDNESVTLRNDPSGAEYGSVSTVDVTVDVTDNDSPGVNVSKDALTVREENTTGDSYTIALYTQPTANVTVTVAGHAGTDVTPSPATLTFTSQNWDTAQAVTVTAVDDTDTANDMVTLTHSAASTDTGYQGIAIASVVVTVTDNDSPSTPPTTGGGGGGGGGSAGGGGGGGGGFGAALVAPQFVDGFRTSRPLALNARVGDAVGDPVAATHPEDSAVTYSLSGANAALFTVDEETGQIRLGQAVTLELGQTYTVNLTGTDSGGTGAIIIVDIVVAEAPYHRYDLNKNGSIEKDEVLAAVADYFAARIEKPLVLEVVSLYFAA